MSHDIRETPPSKPVYTDAVSTLIDVIRRRDNRRRVLWVSGLYIVWMLFEGTVQAVTQYQEHGSVFPDSYRLLTTLVTYLILLCTIASFILGFTRHQRLAQILQIVFLLGAGSFAVSINPTSTPAAGSFYVLALFLASRYGFLDRQAVVKAVFLGVLFLVSVLISAYTYVARLGYAFLGAVAFVVIYTLLWYFAAETEIRGLTRRFLTAQDTVNRDRSAVDLGRGVLAVVHTLSSRVMAIEHAIEMLRDGRGETGMPKLVAAQQDIMRLLENLKQRVVYQSQDEPRAHRIGDVIRGLVELARLGPATAAPSLEVIEDIDVVAPPAEIHTMFDIVLQNALETGARVVSLTVGPGRVVVVANDGPPIPFCLRCRRPDCMGCREFREGRSTKPGGSGIGMVVAREIMSRYGTMRLSSTEKRTEVRFHFR